VNSFQVSLLSVFLLLSCSTATTPKEDEKKEKEPNRSKAFDEYWYDGNGEISSYKISQARYGEMREGNSVLVFVTEPFLKKKQVKADQPDDQNSISVLKLNHTKKFNTGIYPYSIMTSVFFPVQVKKNEHALKVTNSVQEWCGQVFAQLNNRSDFEVEARSYFESEGDQNFHLKKSALEDELWAKIRVNPNSLPIGDLMLIPSMEFVRLKHIELKAYPATATLKKQGDITTYSITYSSLKRTLSISFAQDFPHQITSWKDSYTSGWGKGAKQLTTTAELTKTLKIPYWNYNSNTSVYLRDSLDLP
jgi:hypothetical protein